MFEGGTGLDGDREHTGRKGEHLHVRQNWSHADFMNGLVCTRKFTEPIASRLACISVKDQPESNYLTDGLEDVDKLVLAARNR